MKRDAVKMKDMTWMVGTSFGGYNDHDSVSEGRNVCTRMYTHSDSPQRPVDVGHHVAVVKCMPRVT